MLVVDLLRRKRDGLELEGAELRELVEAYTRDEVPDYQMAAFLMAVYFKGMNDKELAAWVDAMLHSGQVLDMSDIEGFKVDKHSTGGVGDKISLILAPLAVAAGLKVPMISGRGLGHTGGTLDKLESIPGFDVRFPVSRFRELVEQFGCGLIGQTGEVAPADKRLYALRDVTATVECIPLIASSIMSKKLAEGIEALVLDVKVGTGAFMRELDQARELAMTMIGIGERMNRPVSALLTNMDQPLGLAVGNALEVAECIEIMQGKGGPEDIIVLSVELVLEMMALAGMVEDRDQTRAHLRDLMVNGEALAHFKSIIVAHGGEGSICDDPWSALPRAKTVLRWEATEAGVIEEMDTREIGLAALELGAGRRKKEDDVDHAVGLVFERKLGDKLEVGDLIAHLHVNDSSNVDACMMRLNRSLKLGDGSGYVEKPLILDRIVK